MFDARTSRPAWLALWTAFSVSMALRLGSVSRRVSSWEVRAADRLDWSDVRLW